MGRRPSIQSQLCIAGAACLPASALLSATADPPQSSAWPSYRGDGAQRGIAAGTLPDALALRWSFTAEGAIVSSPVVADGRVFFGSDDANLYCLDFDTGERVWSFATDFLIEAPPLVHGGVVYVGSHDYFFYAVDAATGELLWKQEAFEKIISGANIVRASDGRDLVVVGSHDANVYAFDAKTGEKAWTFETGDMVNGTPAVVDNQVIFGGCDTALYVLDGATGAEASRVELGDGCHIAASVGADGDDVFLGHHANEFVAINRKTGERRWTYPSPRFGFYSPPAITEGRVLFGGRDKSLHCVDRATGRALWTFPTRRKVDAAPVVVGGKVVFGSGDGRLYVVDLTTGQEAWSYDIGKPIFSSPAVVDGVILIGANDGRLYAFGDAKGPQ